MKASISPGVATLSRSNRMVDAGREATISVGIECLSYLSSSATSLQKHVIASAAKQSSFLACCSMDCFAALAMTVLLLGRAGLRLQVGALVEPRDARQQIFDFGPGLRRDARARLALRAGGDDAALLQHVFAHGKAGARLLLVADQRQMRVEQIVRGIAAALLREIHDVDQEFREGVAGHRPIGAALHLELEEQ